MSSIRSRISFGEPDAEDRRQDWRNLCAFLSCLCIFSCWKRKNSAVSAYKFQTQPESQERGWDQKISGLSSNMDGNALDGATAQNLEKIEKSFIDVKPASKHQNSKPDGKQSALEALAEGINHQAGLTCNKSQDSGLNISSLDAVEDKSLDLAGKDFDTSEKPPIRATPMTKELDMACNITQDRGSNVSSSNAMEDKSLDLARKDLESDLNVSSLNAMEDKSLDLERKDLESDLKVSNLNAMEDRPLDLARKIFESGLNVSSLNAMEDKSLDLSEKDFEKSQEQPLSTNPMTKEQKATKSTERPCSSECVHTESKLDDQILPDQESEFVIAVHSISSRLVEDAVNDALNELTEPLEQILPDQESELGIAIHNVASELVEDIANGVIYKFAEPLKTVENVVNVDAHKSPGPLEQIQSDMESEIRIGIEIVASEMVDNTLNVEIFGTAEPIERITNYPSTSQTPHPSGGNSSMDSMRKKLKKAFKEKKTIKNCERTRKKEINQSRIFFRMRAVALTKEDTKSSGGCNIFRLLRHHFVRPTRGKTNAVKNNNAAT